MAIYIGSARRDENGRYTGGKRGDQSGNEVAVQVFYKHRKGWNVIRPKSIEKADMIGEMMYRACGNPNIGYSQSDRNDIYNKGIYTTIPTNCDCSSLVCDILRTAYTPLIMNFSTATEITTIKSALPYDFDYIEYKDGMELYVGDILVTKTKGHTAIVTKSDYTRHTSAAFIPTHSRPALGYAIGTNYTLLVELKVRTGAGTKYRAKTHNELTTGGKNHDKDSDGALDKGTVVTCQKIEKVGDDTWIKCPSGWLAAIYKGKQYIG